jgi:ubiquinone/menaquinone biosynthesis C-methylase UbiE
MSSSGGEYIHGTDPEEQRRLSLLNDLLNGASLETMNLSGGERVLDVGSGLGQLTTAIARSVGPKGRVVGIERDATQRTAAVANAKHARLSGRIEFREGDAMQLVLADDEWGSFDLVHTRFLLEHVPDPQVVVDAMVRAARPGGRIVLEDDDHDVLRLWPEPRGITKVWREYIETFKTLGNDPYVGRKLTALLHAAGAEPVRNDWHFFGSCAGHDAFAGFVENFAGVIEGARDAVLGSTSLPRDEFDQAVRELRDWGKLPNAALWYGTYWAEGRRPA